MLKPSKSNSNNTKSTLFSRIIKTKDNSRPINKIIIAGEGGQGVQVLAEILSLAAEKAGKNTSYIPNFGVEQRGGVSLAFVQIEDGEISYPKFSQADLIVAMCDRAIPAIKNFVKRDTIFIFDSSNIKSYLIAPFRNKIDFHLNIPARQVANEKLSTKVANVIFLGALSNFLKQLKNDLIREVMEEKFSKYTKKNPELGRLNTEAFNLGEGYLAKFGHGELKGSEKINLINTFQDYSKIWERFPEYCKSCGICIALCPQRTIRYSKDLNQLGGPLPEIDPEKCAACGLCEKACSCAAIKVTKKAGN